MPLITVKCCAVQDVPIKNNPLGKILYFHNYSRFFLLNLQFSQSRIQTIYAANFVAIIICFKKIKNYNYLNLKLHFSK